jgi:H+/Cl- antiporter ClcA
MTAGLGLFFVLFYAGIVLGVSYGSDTEMRQAAFQMAYRHPQYFIYAGLAFFVLFSLCVLVVRNLIKRAYNSYLSKK